MAKPSPLFQERKDDSYEFSDGYYREWTKTNPFPPLLSPDERMCYKPPQSRLVAEGRWVRIVREIPVDPKPIKWGIYWAAPSGESLNNDGFCPDGKYRTEIILLNEHNQLQSVSLYPYEYVVTPDDILEIELEQQGAYTFSKVTFQELPSLALLEQFKGLTVEDKDIVNALQVDGLSENEACSAFFQTKSMADENQTICYLPHPEYASLLEQAFGKIGIL